MLSNPKWTKEQIQNAVNNSFSFTGVKEFLGATHFKIVKKYINMYNISTLHFTHEPLRTLSSKLEDVLIENSNYSRSSLKSKLINDGYLPYKCEVCGISEWCEKELVLQLDHINGINNDNRLENLRLLCPNCHSQTETWCGKKNDGKEQLGRNKKEKNIFNCYDCGVEISNKSERCQKCNGIYQISINATNPKKTRKKKSEDKKKAHNCTECGCKIHRNYEMCKTCAAKLRINKNCKIKWPSLTELEERLKTTSYVQLGKELGVSDNAIRKHIKNVKKLESAS